MSPADPRHILAVVRPTGLGQPAIFADTTARQGTAYAYFLTAVDRLHNESPPLRVFSEGKLPVEVLAAAPLNMPAQDHRPVAVRPPAPKPAARPASPVAGEIARAEAAKVKVKTKEPVKKRRRGFFARLFDAGSILSRWSEVFKRDKMLPASA
jgi:hypothetical protein